MTIKTLIACRIYRLVPSLVKSKTYNHANTTAFTSLPTSSVFPGRLQIVTSSATRSFGELAEDMIVFQI